MIASAIVTVWATGIPRNVQDDDAGVQFDFAKELDEIRTIIGDEYEFVLNASLRQFPVGPAVQAEMVDVRCFKARGMGQIHQRRMEALVNEKPHAGLSMPACITEPQRSGDTIRRLLTKEQLIFLQLEAEGLRLLPLGTRREIAERLQRDPKTDRLPVGDGTALRIEIMRRRIMGGDPGKIMAKTSSKTDGIENPNLQ